MTDGPLASDGHVRRPQPLVDDLTRPFWEATSHRRLALQRCSACGRFRHPPTPVCPHCSSPLSAWEEISGRGTIYAVAVMCRDLVVGLEALVPLTCVAVTPDEDDGVHLVGNLLDDDAAPVAIGQRVRTVFEPLQDGLYLPNFARLSDGR